MRGYLGVVGEGCLLRILVMDSEFRQMFTISNGFGAAGRIWPSLDRNLLA